MIPKPFLVVFACAMLAMAGPFARALEVPEVRPVRLSGSIRVDGKATEPAWAAGTWHQIARSIQPGKEPEEEARFRVGFDANHIYLFVEATRSGLGSMPDPDRLHDGKVYGDEAIEIFLAPSEDAIEYRHWVINAWGDLYDASCSQQGIVSTTAWDSDIELRTLRSADSWSLEAAIPMAELGITDRTGARWRFNMAHDGPVLTSFADLRSSYHQPSRFARLRFPATLDFSDYAWGFKPGGSPIVVKKESGFQLRQDLTFTNHTGTFHLVTLQAQLTNGSITSAPGAVHHGGLDAGQSQLFSVAPVATAQGEYQLVARLRGRHSGRLLCIERIDVNLTYRPLTIHIHRPFYRQTIYATQDIDAVEGRVTIALPGAEIQGASLASRLVTASTGKAGVTLSEQTRAVSGPTAGFSLPASNLDPGAYRVDVSLSVADGAIYHQHTPVTVAPATDHEWRIDRHRRLLHNGVPFLPLGYFGLPGDEQRTDGTNVNVSYGLQYRSLDDLRAMSVDYQAHGNYFMGYPYLRGKWYTRKDPMSEQEKTALRERIRGMRELPALFGYYLADEPKAHPMVKRRIEQIYAICREEDPFRPTIMLNNSISEIHAFAEWCDIMMPDPYPHFAAGGGPIGKITKVSEYAKAVHEATEGTKPLWLTPQAFSFSDFGRAGQRAPTFTELRNMYYQGVIHGARGFVAFTYRQRHMHPSLAYGGQAINGELRALGDFILAPTTDAAAVMDHADTVQVCARRHGDRWAIFAVNTADRERDVQIRLGKEPRLRDRFHVLREDRTVAVADGMISDSFGPYETHVYTSEPVNPPVPGTLASFKQKIQQAENALVKPGNHAHQSTGARVESDSTRAYAASASSLQNGVTTGRAYAPAKSASGFRLTMTTEEPVPIGRIVLYGTWSAGELEVQKIQAGDTPLRITHRALATVPRRGPIGPLPGDINRLTLEVERATTDRLTIDCGKKKGEAPALYEVEVYGP